MIFLNLARHATISSQKGSPMHAKADREIPLLALLQTMAPDSSISSLRSWIEKGRVHIDGKTVSRAKILVLPGQEVKVGPRVNFVRGGIKILFEDEHLCVIEKPEGLLSVSTDTGNSPNAHDILKRRFHAGRVFPVHRLDRETSGLMVFAYSEAVRDSFKEQFEQKQIEKIYYAVVEGTLSAPEGTWKSYLKEDVTLTVRSTPWESDGKLGITHYKVEAQNKRYSLLRIHLETGRKNQIRVHCKDAGRSIVGDKKYGSTCNPLKRMALHAQKLKFRHPASGKELTFEVAFPHSFAKLLNLN